MRSFKKKNQINYDELVQTLEQGDEAAVQQLLWQPKTGKIDYLSVTTEMLQKLKKMDNVSEKGLSIFKILEKGSYELILFNTPWLAEDLPFSPLVVEKTTGKIVGIMLPFNELHEHLSKRDHSVINDLGGQWVLFTINYRFNNK